MASDINTRNINTFFGQVGIVGKGVDFGVQQTGRQTPALSLTSDMTRGQLLAPLNLFFCEESEGHRTSLEVLLELSDKCRETQHPVPGTKKMPINAGSLFPASMACYEIRFGERLRQNKTRLEENMRGESQDNAEHIQCERETLLFPSIPQKQEEELWRRLPNKSTDQTFT